MPQSTSVIQDERVRVLNEKDVRDGDYVVYWMQQSQRSECNHALEYAVQRANKLGQCLLVIFGLMDDYPEANLRHYTFMLEGLQETRRALANRGIRMVVRYGHPADIAIEAAESASLLVCDRGYLRHQREWRDRVAVAAPCCVEQVESDVVVPVDVTSNKREYAARTIRPKIRKHRDAYLVDLRTTPLEKDSLHLPADGLDLDDLAGVIESLQVDRSVGPVSNLYQGGTGEARRRLQDFLENHLDHYDTNWNRPETSDISHMSMYLHFGQISPVYIALKIRDSGNRQSDDRASYLEELIVRRELACNFVNFCADYDSYRAMPNWARATLLDHRNDKRAYIYTKKELDNAETHNPYWNAAMREMKHTGFMHNHMRMYWGKKMLAWTSTPEYAYRVVLELNNRYFIDGRDANSYANIGWIFGLHDRAFQSRAVYGKIRYMSQGGLKRKADPDAYVEKVDRLIEMVNGVSAP
jgi:deoxyribodipyrimidine photo-lyase